MLNWFSSLNYATQAFIATLFTWSITALGASVVYLFRQINKTLLDAMLGFAAGVMIAASFFSLITPAIEMATSLNICVWLITSIGFFSGGLLLFLGDKIFDKLYANTNKSKLKRSIMLIFSITLHNIPEGLAVGVSFGLLSFGLNGATLSSALMLALGIGLQNFPEGSAVSLPLLREGYSKNKAFFIGQLSGIVEPIAGVIGAILVMKIQIILPFLLTFAAGAMIYVVVEELIPESQTNTKKDVMALFTMIGFTIMMILDIALS